MKTRFRRLLGLSRAVGWVAAIKIFGFRAIRSKCAVAVRVGGAVVEVDPTDSDPFVLTQIFGTRDYDPGAERLAWLRAEAAQMISDGATPVIVDGGANVGYSSLFFAQLFPDCIVLAIEPARSAFERLRTNCAGVSAVKPLRGALWEHGDGVRLTVAQNRSWANHVADAGEWTPSFTLTEVLEPYAPSRLLILKLDIEGAEREVVARCPAEVRAAKCVMVEPHDFMLPGHGCLSPLYSALAGETVDTVLKGENLLFFNLT